MSTCFKRVIGEKALRNVFYLETFLTALEEKNVNGHWRRVGGGPARGGPGAVGGGWSMSAWRRMGLSAARKSGQRKDGAQSRSLPVAQCGRAAGSPATTSAWPS